mmetsp:Transcript_63521/g.132223  ORF Transcript_63521/g.132223 Transcript_63521/m.132223 type:complete len:248 (+) Transcript_63521:3-746(+)
MENADEAWEGWEEGPSTSLRGRTSETGPRTSARMARRVVGARRRRERGSTAMRATSAARRWEERASPENWSCCGRMWMSATMLPGRRSTTRMRDSSVLSADAMSPSMRSLCTAWLEGSVASVAKSSSSHSASATVSRRACLSLAGCDTTVPRSVDIGCCGLLSRGSDTLPGADGGLLVSGVRLPEVAPVLVRTTDLHQSNSSTVCRRFSGRASGRRNTTTTREPAGPRTSSFTSSYGLPHTGMPSTL